MRTPHNECVSSDIAESPSRLREGSGVGKEAHAPNDAPTPSPSRRREGSERRCILSGQTAPRDALMRLAISPDGEVLPDPLAKAPGRGAWIGVARPELEAAMAKGRLKGALARAFKGAALSIPDDLAQRIEDGLRKLLLDRLGLAMRSGTLILGSDRIAEQARKGRIELLLHAADAREDGCKKLDQAWRVGREAEGSGEQGVTLPLDRAALSVALGRENVVHMGVAGRGGDAGAADRITSVLARLLHYTGGQAPSTQASAGAAAPAHDDE